MKGLMGIVLQQGDRGDEVKKLQQLLINNGCSLPLYGIDGIYGSETASAVECFQTKMALPVTGVVDDVTWNRLQGVSSGKSKKWIWWLIILLSGAGWYLFKGGKKGKRRKK